MVDYRALAPVGKTGLQVTRLGLGTAQLGFMYEAVTTEDAMQTVKSGYDEGIRFFDTAALYGKGLAETRVGSVLSTLPRDGYVLQTKAGYQIPEFPPEDVTESAQGRDYSYDGIMRSFEHSLKRLGVDRIDSVLIHDPDHHYDEALNHAYPALAKLRDEGVIRAVGAGMNQSAMLTRFAKEADFDCFLLAGRYTLLDQSGLADLMPEAEERNIAIFIGGPLNSGILADPYAATPMFNYGPAAQKWIEKARKIDAVCKRFDVPLKAAAMQFPFGHKAVASVLTGARSEAELKENIDMLAHEIPSELWSTLKQEGLLAESAPTQ